MTEPWKFVVTNDQVKARQAIGAAQVLTTVAPLTANTVPTAGVITPYNAAAGALSVSLPALSGLAAGAVFGVQKAAVDLSSNTVTFVCAGSDAFDSGAVSHVLKLAAEQRVFQVVSIGGTKYWKIVGGNTSLASMDQRFGTAQRDRYGSRVVVDGDSITIGAGSASAWNQSRGGWNMELARQSQGRINIVANAGVGGTGIATRIANFASKVAAFAPDTVIMCNGTNDLGSMTISDYLVSLQQYYDLCRGIGARLILGGIYPKSVSQSTIAAWNAAYIDWAATRGIIVIPFWELMDPATGAWPSGWTADGTHPLRESPAYAALGALAWKSVSHVFTEPVAKTAQYQGEGLDTDFFTNLTSAITGAASITSLAATTGTLPAGTYTYRVVPRTYWGKNNGYADQSITLGATGGVTITSNATGTYNRRAVYRKGPGETVFKYIGNFTGTGSQTFTDGGLAAQYPWVDGDSSRVPAGLTNGDSFDLRTLAYGPAIRPGKTSPNQPASQAVRGNILRLARREDSGAAKQDYFLITGLTAGQVITVSCKVRGPNTVQACGGVYLYFRDTANATNVDTVVLAYHRMSEDWGVVFGQATVPTGSDRVRISFLTDATMPYIDIAELRVA